MAEPITTATVIASIISLKDELKSILKISKDEIKYLLDNGLLNYVISQKEKMK